MFCLKPVRPWVPETGDRSERGRGGHWWWGRSRLALAAGGLNHVLRSRCPVTLPLATCQEMREREKERTAGYQLVLESQHNPRNSPSLPQTYILQSCSLPFYAFSSFYSHYRKLAYDGGLLRSFIFSQFHLVIFFFSKRSCNYKWSISSYCFTV